MTSQTDTDRADRMADSQDDAFARLVEAHGADLHVHCYRMLGSLHDANDAVQDTLLRAWRALSNFRGQSSHRTWLYRIATNVCLDAIGRRRRRVLPIDYDAGDQDPHRALADVIWIEPFPDQQFDVERGRIEPEARYEQREAVELAFIAALQHLAPRQRAVLILRDVLGFSAKETAEALDTTVPSVNGALARARRAAATRLPQQSQQSTLRALDDDALRDLVERFVSAFERGNVDAILALLAEDATFSMPPYPGVWRGRDAIGRSWLMPGGPPPRLRYVETSAMVRSLSAPTSSTRSAAATRRSRSTSWRWTTASSSTSWHSGRRRSSARSTCLIDSPPDAGSATAHTRDLAMTDTTHAEQQVSAPHPPPHPALLCLTPLVGSWTSTHTTVDGPAGPPLQIRLAESFRWLEGGYFLESHFRIHFGADSPPSHGVMYWFYEPGADRFRTIYFNDEGNFDERDSRYVGIVEDDALVFTGPARFRLRLDTTGQVAVNDDGTIDVDWWLRDGSGSWAPWRSVSYHPATT